MGAIETLSDSDLVDRLNKGDNRAVGELYSIYFDRLYRHAHKMLGGTTLAEDVVHDVFASLLLGLGKLQFHSPIENYLYRAIRYRVIDNFDKSKTRQKYIDTVAKVYHDGNYTTEETVLENELKQQIAKVVNDMPPKMREVFTLSRNEQLSRKEIAASANISEETVKVHLGRAVKLLKAKLHLILVLFS